jgi:hypothetical protein
MVAESQRQEVEKLGWGLVQPGPHHILLATK